MSAQKQLSLLSSVASKQEPHLRCTAHPVLAAATLAAKKTNTIPGRHLISSIHETMGRTADASRKDL